MLGHDIIGFRRRKVVSIFGTLLFATAINGQVSSGTPSNSSDWTDFFHNTDVGSNASRDLCVDCALCFDCDPGCSTSGVTAGLDTNGSAVCGFSGNTDNFWNCACQPENRNGVNRALSDLAGPCSASSLPASAVFSAFCSYISATSLAAAAAPATESSNPASPLIFASIPGTSSPAEPTFLPPTASATSATSMASAASTTSGILGLSSTTSSSVPSSSSSGGLGAGAKAGIAVGSLVGALLIGVALWMFLGFRKERLKREAQPGKTIIPNEKGLKGAKTEDASSAAATHPVVIEEFNPYPGPNNL